MKSKGKIVWGLDNISVGKKLLIMYVLCVLIPILSINLILYSSIVKWVSMQEMNRVNACVDNAKASIAKFLENCVSVAIMLSSDITFSDMMDKDYPEPLEYVDDYRLYLGNALSKYIPSYPQIQTITLYTDNPTIVEGGNYSGIDDSIRETEWFKNILLRSRSILLYTDSQSGGTNSFSLIKSLNSVKSKGKYLKILKIDIRTDLFESIIQEDLIDGNLFLLNKQNDIILSTEKDSGVHAEVLRRYDKEGAAENYVVSYRYFQRISYLDGWRIIGIFPEKSVFEGLRSSRNYVVFLALVSLILASAIVFFISRSLSTRLKALTKHIKKARKQSFEIIESGIGNDELGELIKEYNMMAIKIKELIQDVYQAEITSKNLELERKQAELNALESQINPHFLYNTLNIIKMKSLLKNESETAEIIKCVAKTFRRVITWGNDLVTIDEEVEFIREYLKIQKYRFEERVDYRIDVAPECAKYRIPKMSIQAFMENASIHGVENSKCFGVISLDIFEEEKYLNCIIQDSGEGIEEEKLKKMIGELCKGTAGGKNIGIANVYKRLVAYYGNNFYFNMENRIGGGLKVTMKIPCGEER